MVHSQGARRLRGGHGGCPGPLRRTLRPSGAGGLFRRDLHPDAVRYRSAHSGGPGEAAARGLRVPARRHPQPVPLHRAPGGLAARGGNGAAHRQRLRPSDALAGGRGPAHRPEAGISPHTQAWQLAEHSRNRVSASYPAAVLGRGIRTRTVSAWRYMPRSRNATRPRRSSTAASPPRTPGPNSIASIPLFPAWLSTSAGPVDCRTLCRKYPTRAICTVPGDQSSNRVQMLIQYGSFPPASVN